MKMVTAIVNKQDSSFVCDALRSEGIAVTKMASTGGFLRSGNVTLLIGVDDCDLNRALEVVRTHCSTRTMDMPVVSDAPAMKLGLPRTAKVTVGGATVFVTDVEHFEKM